MRRHEQSEQRVTAVVVGGWLVSVALLGVALVASGALDEPVTEPLGWRAATVTVVAVTAQFVLLRALLDAGLDAPRRGLLGVCALVPLAALAGSGAATGATTPAVLLAAYLLLLRATTHPPLRSLLAGGLLLACAGVIRAAGDLSAAAVGEAALQAVSTIALGAVVGAVVGARREATRARTDELRALAGEQAALVEVAVARQRTAMARELHDIAAHHLSGITVMTAALDRQIDTDPAGAKVAVREVRQQSTAMLRDLRHLVALLRDGEPAEATGHLAGRTPAHLTGLEPETLDGIRRLVEDSRRGGREVDLSVLGADTGRWADLEVGPLAQLAAYRTVQEALTNAARHAPGARCEVVLDVRDPAVVVLGVRNHRPPSPGTPGTPGATAATGSASRERGGGFGIIGMRERAELTGSELATGPSADGGFEVTLRLPRLEEAPR